MAGKCSHEDSRLTCIECSAPICSQCLVQCPVGFRCKSCVGAMKNPLTSVTPRLVVRTLAVCAGIGFGAGWILQFISVPFFSCIISYFLGLFAGRWLAKVIDYKMGSNVGKTIVFGLLIGMSFTPYSQLPLVMFEIFRDSIIAHPASIFDGLIGIVSCIFCPLCFVVGVLRPTVWGERW